MSDLLQIGASSVRAYQSALGTVGENIANADVAGFSRRSIALNEISTGGIVAKNNPGLGVTVSGITRASDIYAASAARAAGSDLSRTQASATWLDRIETALTGNDLTARTTAFFDAASSLSADPASTALRANLLGTATSTAASFTATGQAFDQIDADLDGNAAQAANTLTSLATSLARVNDGLGRTQGSTSASAQLADQRDQILDQMSAVATVNVSTDALGRATVKLGGATGTTFVSLTYSGSISYGRDDSGAASFSVYANGQVSPLSTDGGAIAGLVEGAQKVRAARAGIDAIASSFTGTVNTLQAQGDDPDGRPGQPLFATGDRPTDLRVVMTDGNGIAAAGRGTGPRDASNLAALQSARMAKGFEASTTALITGNAAAIGQKKTIADAQTSIRSGAETVLSSKTGVSLDSEAVDLLRFQQAYSASSRIIQVARDTFQSILDIR